MIVFVHVARTAGSTIHSWFRRPRLPELADRCLVVDGSGGLEQRCVPLTKGNEPFYLGGHISFNDARDVGVLSRPHIIFSVTRDPVERAASLYMLIKRSPGWIPAISERVGDRDFGYFYDVCVDQQMTFPNGLCKQIAGSDDFDTAAAFIETKYSFVGSSNQLDLVRLALIERVGAFLPNFHPQPRRTNAAMHGVAIGDIVSDALAERIREANYEDHLLHQWVEANGIVVGTGGG